MAAKGWCPFAIAMPLTTGEQDDDDPTIPKEGICNHITGGTDSRDWLQNVKNDASVHFLIRLEGGVAKIYQFASIFKTTYGNGRHSGLSNPWMPEWIKSLIRRRKGINYALISIEHEARYPQDMPYKEAMIRASIKLHKWIADQIPTIKIDRDHIIGHYQIQHVDRAFCPGGPGGALFPFDRIIRELTMPESFTPPGANHAITVPEFIRYYQGEPKALQYWGLPIEDVKVEKLSDGKEYTVQYFERARFEKHGSIVLLGLLGVEVRS